MDDGTIHALSISTKPPTPVARLREKRQSVDSGMGARPGPVATMEHRRMASDDQRARRADGFLRLADAAAPGEAEATAPPRRGCGGAARGLARRRRDHRRLRADRLLERGRRAAVRPRALAGARRRARLADLPRSPADRGPGGPAARGRGVRCRARPAPARARRPPRGRPRDPGRHRDQAGRNRRVALARRLPARRERAQRARARAPCGRPAPIGRSRPRPGRARGHGAWTSSSSRPST